MISLWLDLNKVLGGNGNILSVLLLVVIVTFLKYLHCTRYFSEYMQYTIDFSKDLSRQISKTE